ncbi:MAG TPA: iron ABC transporter ATP-binding protein [Clostridiales bacterium]|nr:iron ABC transporter ATP-binding protein [Clostridiales bacterium]
MSDTVYFRTKDLAVGYHGVPLIKDIGIALEKGRILTLIGPNGSGKSTILKSIAKYLKALHGTVYLDGRSLDGMTNKDLSRRMSVVLTEKLKTELMTCEDVVATGRYPYTGQLGILSEQDRAHVREAMALVHTLDLRARDFTKISDGQRQRVLLARAICQQPRIIVLDEPTSFLDIHYKLELLSILRDMAKRRKIAVILSMHEIDLAQKISDYVLCVKGETIAHYGTPGEIFERALITELYGLSNGSYNPLFGSMEMGKPQGEPKTFVIAGGGTGAETFRALQKNGVPFIAGILHENDVDFALAGDLAAEVVGEKSFEEIGEAAFQRAVEKLASCESVINCLRGYGTMNARNRDLLAAARDMGLEILDEVRE